jgi:hypothetical protein
VGGAGGLGERKAVEVDPKLSCEGTAASAWLIKVYEVDEVRYRKWGGFWCGFGFAFESLSWYGSVGRSEYVRVGEAWGELYIVLVVTLPPGIGRGRLWYGFCDE